MIPSRTYWIAQGAETISMLALAGCLLVRAPLGLELGLVVMAFASRFWGLRHTSETPEQTARKWYHTPTGWAWVLCAAAAVISSI